MNPKHRVIRHIHALMRAQNDLIESVLDSFGEELSQAPAHTDDQLELPFNEPPPF